MGDVRYQDRAQFYTYIDDFEDGTICFFINSLTERTGERHPFFEKNRVSHLASRAIKHFEQNWTINGINFEWVQDTVGLSSNYRTYLDTRNQLRRILGVDPARRQAALATWTVQRIALPNGFSNLVELREYGGSMTPSSVKGAMWRDPVV